MSVIQRYEVHLEKLGKKSLGSMKDFFALARIAAYGTRDSGNRLRQPNRRIHGPDVRTWRRKEKAAREEPPFLKLVRSGQKMNLPVICAIL